MKRILLLGTMLGFIVAFMAPLGAAYADGDLELLVTCPPRVQAGTDLMAGVRVRNVGTTPVAVCQLATGFVGNPSDSLMNLGVYGPFVRLDPGTCTVVPPGADVNIGQVLIGTVPVEFSGKFVGVFVSIIDDEANWYGGGSSVAVE